MRVEMVVSSRKEWTWIEFIVQENIRLQNFKVEPLEWEKGYPSKVRKEIRLHTGYPASCISISIIPLYLTPSPLYPLSQSAPPPHKPVTVSKFNRMIE